MTPERKRLLDLKPQETWMENNRVYWPVIGLLLVVMGVLLRYLLG